MIETVTKHDRLQAETARPRHTILNCGDLEIDLEARLVRIAGQEVPVTYVEFEILHRMLRDPSRVFARGELLILGATDTSPSTMRSVDIHISRLRKKTAVARSFVIETVPHVGYRCREIVYVNGRTPPVTSAT